jgi:hypothetical protein
MHSSSLKHPWLLLSGYLPMPAFASALPWPSQRLVDVASKVSNSPVVEVPHQFSLRHQVERIFTSMSSRRSPPHPIGWKTIVAGVLGTPVVHVKVLKRQIGRRELPWSGHRLGVNCTGGGRDDRRRTHVLPNESWLYLSSYVPHRTLCNSAADGEGECFICCIFFLFPLVLF